MTKKPNVLWIMADQLRFDYLSCYGHPHLHTPHIDALAGRGVRFTNTYVQSPVCGPSRMSAYTGRYVRSHGSTWNGMPLRIGEPTLGDHLREAGARAVLVGKTHMIADREGMAWLGIDPESEIGVRRSECGFDAFERDDGLHPDSARQNWSAYDDYLVSLGYKSENPWEDFANSGVDENGDLMSAWLLKNSRMPANVPEEHSETAYMTDRAMAFMEDAMTQDEPWLCHLSYIKPHWPYIVPEPYHVMFGAEHIVDPIRAEAEKDTDHPLLAAYQDARVCRSFARDHVREHGDDLRWSLKYIRCEGFDPVMFDLETDPHELRNVGRSQVLEHKKVRTRMEAALLTWATQHHTRITATKEVLNRQGIAAELGILIGFWDEAEFEATTGMPFSSLVPAGPPEG